MSNRDIEIPLKYRIRESILNENAPAIFFLHGYGSNMEDLFSLSQFFSDEWAIISFQASESIGFGGYAWAELDFSNLACAVYIHSSYSFPRRAAPVSYTHLTLPTKA